LKDKPAFSPKALGYPVLNYLLDPRFCWKAFSRSAADGFGFWSLEPDGSMKVLDEGSIEGSCRKACDSVTVLVAAR
jgi:hypothetical protein